MPIRMSIFPGGHFPGVNDAIEAMKSEGKRHNALATAIADLKEAGSRQPILAYRGWSVQGGRLSSVGVGNVAWPARRVFEAICQAGGGAIEPHNAPHPQCTCGLYGFATPASLSQVMDSAVLGRVQLGGEVVVCGSGEAYSPHDCDECLDPGNLKPHAEHAHGIMGFRAQSGYPSALYLWPKKHPKNRENPNIHKLANEYGVDCTTWPPELLEWQEQKDRAALEARRQEKLRTADYVKAQAKVLEAMYAQQAQANVAQQQGLGQWQQQQGGGYGLGLSNGANIPSYLLPGGGGPGAAPQHPVAPHPGHANLAAALGLVIATPETTATHDALTQIARQFGLVK